MALEGLFAAVREGAGPRAWEAAVKLARDGAVEGVSDDGDEVVLRVKAVGRAVPYEVHLWPEEPDWGCECELPGDACVHVAAAVISLQTLRQSGLPTALPTPSKTFRVTIEYELTSQGEALSVRRMLRRPNGDRTVLGGALAQMDVIASPADASAESLLIRAPAGALSGEAVRRLIVLLGRDAVVTLDGAPIRLDPAPVLFRVRVTDDKAGFKLGLYRPAGIDRLFRGAALVGDVLHPTSHGELNAEQRRMLVQGVRFGEDEVAALVGDYLPRLREKAPVDIQTTRLPTAAALTPRVVVHLTEKPAGLEVRPELVYGDPPIARVTSGGGIERLSDAVIPARNLGAEMGVRTAWEERFQLSVGFKHHLGPSEAAVFLQQRLPLYDGPVVGRVDPERFRVVAGPLVPRLAVAEADGGWSLGVSFGHEGGSTADPTAVLDAWRSGRSLVPLMDGGWAPLPADWLREHGALLRELLEARDSRGRVDRNATAALVELLDETQAEVPLDLRRLHDFLAGGGGLPEFPPPPGLTAELRPYQHTGWLWLRFLREMDLSGILADDMGLGKTIMALAALLDASPPGARHLVVAPTSVLTNWANEAARFAPGLSVNLYHGPSRKLTDATVTLTSYALLRLDADILRAKVWSYAILDEAQTIKNPQSQTARAAFALRARHRLCLTGTPIENRLEELWSLFRFCLPGLLGSEEAFRDRFVRPIEAGDDKARRALRTRVRPYVLRRLKQQVEKDLPLLTEMVVRCEMSPEQRKVYEAVRLTARRDVLEAIAARGARGATFQVLEALLRMRQACCDPRLLPGGIGESIASAKLDEMEDLLVELVCDDHKALVFSQWTGLLDLVEPRLQKLGINYVRLDGSTRDRGAVIARFQAQDGPPVFLLSLKAGGTGLNLTAADYVLLLDPWWNPAVERQATDRAHRIGQTRPVVSLRLIAEGTVEERILELQAAKRELADAALGEEGGFVQALSGDELRSLFESA
jgi:superfamily II DNA or RNA helicase